MTKVVRVINADKAPGSILVEVYQQSPGGESFKLEEVLLEEPADLAHFTIWEGKYLVVKEVLPKSKEEQEI